MPRLLFFAVLLAAQMLVITHAQQPQQDKSAEEARKAIHGIAVRLYEDKATEEDYLVCQRLHGTASRETNKRIVLHLAAHYQRSVRKTPLRTLEIVLPHLIGSNELNAWKKTNQVTMRSVASGKTNEIYNLTELPDVTRWRVDGSRGPLALEAAHALHGMKKTATVFEIIEIVGRNNNDDVRVLAAECAADLYTVNEEYEKANECLEYAVDLLTELRGRDHYYEQGDRVFHGDERKLIARRLKEKQEKSLSASENAPKPNIRPLPNIDVKKWPNAKPKVDRLDIKAQFIICMISDGEGGAFVGTEDHGIYHYDNEGSVKQYTKKAGMGDSNAYALAIDKLGRLWAGNLHTGVSVFNGEKWRNYDVTDGPVGERVFDIQICPVDGDVWMATNAGLTRYKIEVDQWEHFTRVSGLPEDQASSLAFKKDGTLIVGTQCHGLAIFTRQQDGGYKYTQNITAPERYGPGNCSPVPLIPYGNGLPTNQINQILVARDETIWIATPTGLVKSNATLTKLSFVRGRNYAAKVKGLYGGAPKGWKECPKEELEQLLPEDYITCLTEEDNGTIWIGTRQRGFMAIDPKTGRRGMGDRASMGMADNYVSAILPMSDGSPLIGLYIGGVIKPQDTLRLKPDRGTNRSQNHETYTVEKIYFSELPTPVVHPTIDNFKKIQAMLEDFSQPLPNNHAVYYGEDWLTQGDWIGRYGRQYTILCGVNSPYDRKMFYHQNEVQVNHFIGPNTPRHDVIRHWVHWLKTDNTKTLFDPFIGTRRQAEWDDHGEVYPLERDGPDLWYLINFKREGVYRLSMYFFNKDGHAGMNRMRDYLIEIHPFSRPWTKFDDWPHFSVAAEKQARTKPLARTRVRDFWGGKYKTFVVTGPGVYAVKIDRNYSFNTILSSVMVDRLVGEKDRYDDRPTPWVYVRYVPPKLPKREQLKTREGLAAFDLWECLESNRDKVNIVLIEKQLERQIMKMAAIGVTHGSEAGMDVEAEKQFLRHLTWKVKYWNDDLRNEFAANMKASWEVFQKANPHIVKTMAVRRSDKPRPNSPVDIWKKK